MWTSRNRARYDRSKLRYPSDVTDEEWELMVPLVFGYMASTLGLKMRNERRYERYRTERPRSARDFPAGSHLYPFKLPGYALLETIGAQFDGGADFICSNLHQLRD